MQNYQMMCRQWFLVKPKVALKQVNVPTASRSSATLTEAHLRSQELPIFSDFRLPLLDSHLGSLQIHPSFR